MKPVQNGFIYINNLHIIYTSIIILLCLYFYTNQHAVSIYKNNFENKKIEK